MGQLDSSIIGQVRPFQMPSFAASQEQGYRLRDLGRQEDAARTAEADQAVIRRALDWATDHQTGALDAPKAVQWLATLGQRPDLAQQMGEKMAAQAKANAPAYRAPHVVGPGGMLVNDAGTILAQTSPASRDTKPPAPPPSRTTDRGIEEWDATTTAWTPTGRTPYRVPAAPGGSGGPREPKAPRGTFVETTDGIMLGDPTTGTLTTVRGPDGRPAFKAQSGESAKVSTMADEGARAVEDIDASWSRLGPAERFKTAFPMGLGDSDVQIFRTAASNLSDVIGRMRSGGAITGGEMVTFKGFIPRPTDRPETVTYKIGQMRRMMQGIKARMGASAADAPEEQTSGGGRGAAVSSGGHQVPRAWAAPGGKTTTMAEVQATAQQHGKTVAQVVADAKRNGYSIR